MERTALCWTGVATNTCPEPCGTVIATAAPELPPGGLTVPSPHGLQETVRVCVAGVAVSVGVGAGVAVVVVAGVVGIVVVVPVVIVASVVGRAVVTEGVGRAVVTTVS